MGKEIERKFLLRENGVDYTTKKFLKFYSSIDKLKKEAEEKGERIIQGYLPLKTGLNIAKELGFKLDFKAIESRLRMKGNSYYFTLKGDGGLVRDEFPEPNKQEIPEKLFEKYWHYTKGKRLEKKRLEKMLDNFNAEIDIYSDRDLIVAEFEVSSVKDLNEVPVLGKDVSDSQKYKNMNLSK